MAVKKQKGYFSKKDKSQNKVEKYELNQGLMEEYPEAVYSTNGDSRPIFYGALGNTYKQPWSETELINMDRRDHGLKALNYYKGEVDKFAIEWSSTTGESDSFIKQKGFG
eukprot:231254_1